MLHIEYHNISGEDGGQYGNATFETVKDAQVWLDHELASATSDEIEDLALDTFTANDEQGNIIADLNGVE